MNSFQRCPNEITLMWGLRQASELALPEKTGRQLSRAYVTQIVEVPRSWLLAPSDFLFEFPGVRTLACLSLTLPESVNSYRSGYAGFAIMRCRHSEINGKWGKSRVPSWWRRFYRCSIHIFSGSTKNPMGSGRGNQATGSSSMIPSATAST